jgi:hypothetical protein
MSKGVFPLVLIIFLIALVLISGCANGGAQLANPAAKYCVEQGNKYTITTNADGSQTGYCTLKNNMVCEEWSYMRGSCGAANTTIPQTNSSASCSQDSDCIPAECCHPTSCTTAPTKKPCNLMCTEVCMPGTMDCGQGSCKCINSKCEAVYK